MAKFSDDSKEKLLACHSELIHLFTEVIKYVDCRVIFGHRTKEEQFDLFKIGRMLKDNTWVIEDKSRIVTYKDGIHNLSKHNYNPSLAVDVVPYPVDWKDEKRLHRFAGFVLGIAESMKIKVINGGDWNNNWILSDQILMDVPHFQLAERQ